MAQTTIVFKISNNLKNEIIEFYQDRFIDKKPPYSVFQVKDFDCVTTLYESGKIMFQGMAADIEASYWIERERILNNRNIKQELDKDSKKKDDKKNELKDERFKYISTIGSDEVGTGDYFGPIVVTASYVDIKDKNKLEDIGIRDSKKLTDDKIKLIAPKLIKEIPHVTFILTPSEYNQKGITNMNKIKAILHNKVLYALVNKDIYDYEKIVMDQFVYPAKYFEHIESIPKKITNITFTTHAEDKCLSVAVSSIISRYIFLKEMDNLSDSLGIPLQKGAGENVDKQGIEIIEKFGFDKLKEIAKLNFKNTDKIKFNMNF
ncbi:MAG: ribonuclease HIII [Bacilli bacterium]|nr:ribonuclease HIII [Bacilli bacterium]